jgi:hypothetical protein
MATFLNLRKTVNYLIGQTNYGSKIDNVVIDAHINSAVKDICNRYPFSWNLKTANLTLTAGTAALSSDYNPRWHITDARIVNSSNGDDHIFAEVSVRDRDNYNSSDYVYWMSTASTTGICSINSKTLTGTVAVYYQFLPTDMSVSSDVCVIPDENAVSYLAASRLFLLDPSMKIIQKDFEDKANNHITAMWVHDCDFGPAPILNNPIDDNGGLNDMYETLEISVG